MQLRSNLFRISIGLVTLAVMTFAPITNRAQNSGNTINNASTAVADSTNLPMDKQSRFLRELENAYAQMNGSYAIIEPMLKNSCYDCHSQKTDYPWYHSLPIIGGWMDEHVEHGLKHVDFTDGFPFGGRGSQLKILSEIREEIEEGAMPIFSYRIMHWGKLIEGERRDTLFAWIDAADKFIRNVHMLYEMPLPDDVYEDHNEVESESDER